MPPSTIGIIVRAMETVPMRTKEPKYESTNTIHAKTAVSAILSVLSFFQLHFIIPFPEDIFYYSTLKSPKMQYLLSQNVINVTGRGYAKRRN